MSSCDMGLVELQKNEAAMFELARAQCDKPPLRSAAELESALTPVTCHHYSRLDETFLDRVGKSSLHLLVSNRTH